jgi:hypothetical protein
MVFIPQYAQQSDTPFTPMEGPPVDTQVGDAVEAFGQQAGRVAADVGEFIDRKDALGAMTEANTQTTKLLDGDDNGSGGAAGKPAFNSLQGQAAVDAGPQTLQQLKAAYESAGARLRSPGARQVYQEMAQDRLAALSQQVRRGVAGQRAAVDDLTYSLTQQQALTELGTTLGRDDAAALAATRMAATANLTRAQGLAGGNAELLSALKQQGEFQFFGEALKLVRPEQALKLVDQVFSEDKASPYRARALAMAQDQVLGPIALATEGDGGRPDYLGAPANAAAGGSGAEARGPDAWAPVARDVHGDTPLAARLARAGDAADRLKLDPSQRADLEALTRQDYQRQRRQSLSEQQDRDADLIARVGKGGRGAVSGQDLRDLSPLARMRAHEILARGPVRADDPHAAASVLSAIVTGGDLHAALLAAQPRLTPASAGQFKALQLAGDQGAAAYQAARRAAATCDAAARQLGMVYGIEPGSDKAAALVSELSLQMLKDQAAGGEAPTLAHALEQGRSVAAMLTLPEQGDGGIGHDDGATQPGPGHTPTFDDTDLLQKNKTGISSSVFTIEEPGVGETSDGDFVSEADLADKQSAPLLINGGYSRSDMPQQLQRVSTLVRGDKLPPPPRPPPMSLQKNDGGGSGPFGSEKPTVVDQLGWNAAKTIAERAKQSPYSEAGKNLAHYLEATGTPVAVDLKDLLADETVKEEYDRQMDHQIQEAYGVFVNNKSQDRLVLTAQTKWFDVTATKFPHGVTAIRTPRSLAIGSGSMSIAARYEFVREGNRVTMKLTPRVDFFDRYNWDQAKTVHFGPIKISDEQMGRLQTVGLAKTFEMRGEAWPGARAWDVSGLLNK